MSFDPTFENRSRFSQRRILMLRLPLLLIFLLAPSTMSWGADLTEMEVVKELYGNESNAEICFPKSKDQVYKNLIRSVLKGEIFNLKQCYDCLGLSHAELSNEKQTHKEVRLRNRDDGSEGPRSIDEVWEGDGIGAIFSNDSKTIILKYYQRSSYFLYYKDTTRKRFFTRVDSGEKLEVTDYAHVYPNPFLMVPIDFLNLDGSLFDCYSYSPINNFDINNWSLENASNSPILSSLYTGKGHTSYKDRKRDGLSTWWHENGQKKLERTYKGGKRDGLSTWWYENGQKTQMSTYQDGKRDGPYTAWHKNGQKWVESIYKEGKEEGLWTEWHENGQKRHEGTWKEGKEEGLWTEWDEQGNIAEQTTYKNGEAVK